MLRVQCAKHADATVEQLKSSQQVVPLKKKCLDCQHRQNDKALWKAPHRNSFFRFSHYDSWHHLQTTLHCHLHRQSTQTWISTTCRTSGQAFVGFCTFNRNNLICRCVTVHMSFACLCGRSLCLFSGRFIDITVCVPLIIIVICTSSHRRRQGSFFFCLQRKVTL